jgi:hypothetical protein
MFDIMKHVPMRRTDRWFSRKIFHVKENVFRNGIISQLRADPMIAIMILIEEIKQVVFLILYYM